MLGIPTAAVTPDIQNARCVACNWGPTPEDYRHILSVHHVYQLPFGHNRTYLTHGVLAYVLGDWNISGMWAVQSGGRFTPTLGTNVSNSSGGGSQRPDRIASGILPPLDNPSLVRHHGLYRPRHFFVWKLRHRYIDRPWIFQCAPQSGTAFSADRELRIGLPGRSVQCIQPCELQPAEMAAKVDFYKAQLTR